MLAKRIPGAVRPEQADTVGALDLEIDAFHGLEFAKALRQPSRGDKRGVVHLMKFVRLRGCNLFIAVHDSWTEQ